MAQLSDPKKEIRALLTKLFPELKPEKLEPMVQLVLKEITREIQNQPTLELPSNKEALKLRIEDSIAKNILEEEHLKISLEKYTKDLIPQEQKELKDKIKKEMEALRKKGLNLIKNPKAHQIMINLLVLKHCPKHRLKKDVDLVKETKHNLDELKRECEKLFKELEKTDPTLALKLKKHMDKAFDDIEKNLKLEKEPTKEISLLFRLLAVFSDQPKEFEKLDPETKVTIVTQGSKEGKYRMIPDNALPMPTDIIVFPNTPASNEIKPLYDPREIPTLNLNDKK